MLFWPKPGVPEYNISDREKCCWPYLIGQYPFFTRFWPNTPGAPDFFYFAQLPPIFGIVILPSGGILEQTSTGHDNI